MSCSIQVFNVQDIPKRYLDLIVGQFTTQCKHKVSYQYGKYQVSKADYILVAFSDNVSSRSGSSRTTVCGFLLLQHLRKVNTAYIDVVCSSARYGGRLIKSAEEYAKQVLNVRLMKLSALPHVVQYYEKLMYKETDDACVPNLKKKRKGKAENGYRMTKCLKY